MKALAIWSVDHRVSVNLIMIFLIVAGLYTVLNMKREMFPEGADIKIGVQFHGAGPNGEPIVVTVASIEGDDIVIDGNHALAGQTLHFAVSVIEVREATEDEISHGHIHGAGCSH